MKYGDIISSEVTLKLINTSFDSPEINLWAYKFYKCLLETQEFVDRERNKYIVQYGEKTEDGRYALKGENYTAFQARMSDLYNMELEKEIPYYPLSESNFEPDNCKYATDKEMWLSAKDINSILLFLDKVKEEAGA